MDEKKVCVSQRDSSVFSGSPCEYGGFRRNPAAYVRCKHPHTLHNIPSLGYHMLANQNGTVG